MKPIKLVSKNGVKSRCQKVVLSLFFANYFLAEKCRRFSKAIIRKFRERKNSHYGTSYKSSDYVRNVMTPTGASSACSNCRVLLSEILAEITV